MCGWELRQFDMAGGMELSIFRQCSIVVCTGGGGRCGGGDHHFRQSLLSTFLHPLGFSFLFAAGLYGSWREVVGLGVRWKERLYGETSGGKENQKKHS